ncbi:MAG: hypothetical protein ACPGUV_04065, partial [Polyangiales bacterium]
MTVQFLINRIFPSTTAHPAGRQHDKAELTQAQARLPHRCRRHAWRVSAWLCGLAALWGQASAAQAQSFDRCVADGAATLKAAGATPWGASSRAFLSENEVYSEFLTLPKAGCVGFFAVGHQEVRDLDLMIHSWDGKLLAEDISVESYAYLRVCGKRAQRIVLTLRMYKGRGEYRLMRFQDAPPRIADLNARIGACFARKPGVKRPLAQVGPEPPGWSDTDALAALGQRLAGLGYRRSGPSIKGKLLARGRSFRMVRLGQAGCYAVAAVGHDQRVDVDLVAYDRRGQLLARDTSDTPHALVKLCVGAAAAIPVEVRMFAGSGAWRLQPFLLHDRASRGQRAWRDAKSRIRYAETLAQMRRHGLTGEVLGYGEVRDGEATALPVDMQAGRCYALGALTEG